ncbi:MAG TPA: ABC transporter permease [Opitutaceae bacterium]|nr:ABC transporter permease [Opitutaceae bacterium]
MTAPARLVSLLETLGLTPVVPLVRLCLGEDPREQLALLVNLVGLPVLGGTLFLLFWAAVAGGVKTSIGSVPGPAQVWRQAVGLFREHQAEREHEREFYARQTLIRARYEKAFPGRAWPAHKYSGAPTYVDQIETSLETVFAGFVLASLIAVPVGVFCGLSKGFYNAVNPFVQIFRPVSPLAWLPIVMILVSALYGSASSGLPKAFVSSAITVALCSLWPTLINTAIGVGSIDHDHLNVARVLRLPLGVRLRKIVLPSALPYIFTGLRLSLGVGWMVLIAAEMLAQNPGLGKFVWDMFQNGSSDTLALIMVAVFTIGIIGFALDRMMLVLQRLVSYDRAAVR